MKSPLPSFADVRPVAVALLAVSLSACGLLGGGPRGDGGATEAPRNINLPPVPRVEISDAARSDYAQALSYLHNQRPPVLHRDLKVYPPRRAPARGARC